MTHEIPKKNGTPPPYGDRCPCCHRAETGFGLAAEVLAVASGVAIGLGVVVVLAWAVLAWWVTGA